MHVHVCLVSEQTIPNVLSILHFNPDGVLLISTDKMEKEARSESIKKTLALKGFDISKVYEPIVVIQDSITDCTKKIESKLNEIGDATFTVNITGGTKIMSISAFEVFKDYGAQIGYIPIGKNEYITVFPKKQINLIEKINIRLGVIDYLTAYGLEILNKKELDSKAKNAFIRKELTEYIVNHGNEIQGAINTFVEKLREQRKNKKGVSFEYQPSNAFEQKMLENAGFENKDRTYRKHLSKDEIEYFTGGWLEEYCFNELVKLKTSLIDDIVIDIQIRKGEYQNEIDVMFTSNNALYTIECKSGSQSHDPDVDILYKIAALRQNFGLSAKSFLVTTSSAIFDREGKIKPQIQARANDYKTKIITKEELSKIKEIVQTALGGRK